MNGKEQVEAMTKLMNSEQRAPSDAAWKPDELAGFRIGDTVTVPTLGRCLVIALIPPSLLQVTTAGGGVAKVGWRAATKVKR